MREIRVKVRLTNAVDESLVRQGKRKKPRTYETDAIVDTGAIRTVIPPDVLRRLGLGIRGQRLVEYADGRKEPINLSEAVIVEILGRDTVEDALVLGDQVLIGQTVLEALDLLADCANRRVIPNPAHPDQAVLTVRRLRPRDATR